MMNSVPKKREKQLLNKLRSPIHISYICENILQCNEYNAKEILKEYIEQDIIEEVKDMKNYYKLKSNKIK